MTERELQREAVRRLKELGFTVVVTSNRRATLNSRGTPDVFVYVGEACWAGVEFKVPSSGRSRGKIYAEQSRLASEGKISIVTSVEEAIEAVIAAKEKTFHRGYDPDVQTSSRQMGGRDEP